MAASRSSSSPARSHQSRWGEPRPSSWTERCPRTCASYYFLLDGWRITTILVPRSVRRPFWTAPLCCGHSPNPSPRRRAWWPQPPRRGLQPPAAPSRLRARTTPSQGKSVSPVCLFAWYGASLASCVRSWRELSASDRRIALAARGTLPARTTSAVALCRAVCAPVPPVRDTPPFQPHIPPLHRLSRCPPRMGHMGEPDNRLSLHLRVTSYALFPPRWASPSAPPSRAFVRPPRPACAGHPTPDPLMSGRKIHMRARMAGQNWPHLFDRDRLV